MVEGVVSGDRAHSIVLKPVDEDTVDNTALFLHYKPHYSAKSQEPEVSQQLNIFCIILILHGNDK